MESRMTEKKVNLADKEATKELLKQLYGDRDEGTQIAKDGESENRESGTDGTRKLGKT